MTLEQLLNCEDPEVLEKLSDKQLEEYFAPCFEVTRPDLARIKNASNKVDKKRKIGGGGIGELLALEFLAKQGINLKK